MDASREMTLSEWVNKLPKHHAAVREFDALIAHATEMQAVLTQIHDRMCKFTHERLTDEQREEVNSIINVIKAARLTETPRPGTPGEMMGEK